MDWLEASKVSYYKNDEVPKIIDDINQRTNSQMRCCRRACFTILFGILLLAIGTIMSVHNF
jgi:hypothetical protein